jgi:hypothetical protein
MTPEVTIFCSRGDEPRPVVEIERDSLPNFHVGLSRIGSQESSGVLHLP